ncbi:quinate repressor [Microdochium trichocladiopsis]|uniref:Quinate repressor n=1 Tax=Microdochium trichocladiopsis TaxID=1682393 RepID=A0A9P8XRZ6_9PEZI|nr:quinate repressor [Microdochium trichocladiopsis]KAH7014334.1 quinate repressor [Microdochium trichocladiopsis]
MAATALKRRIADTSKLFLDATGMSAVVYKKTYGSADYQRRVHSLLQKTLATNAQDAIIVTSWVDRSALALLQEFAATHPVIHIVRDSAAIKKYLRVADNVKLDDILQYSARAFRAVMNHEFFNVSEDLSQHQEPTDAAPDVKAPAPYLTLKRAERHFLKFLSLLMPKGSIPFFESAFPLAQVPLEARKTTFVLPLRLSQLVAEDLDIEALEGGADAIEIVVDDLYEGAMSSGGSTPETGALSKQRTHLAPERASQISSALARIRRSTVIPIIYHVSWPAVSLTTTISTEQVMTYLEHFQHGLKLCPEYITVDIRLESTLLSHLVALRGHSKVIGVAHIADHTPPAWEDPVWISFYQKAHAVGCDVVRLTRPAVDFEDNFEVAKLRHTIEALPGISKPLLSAYNTGIRGRHSAVFNPLLSPVRPTSSVLESSESMMTTCPSPTITVQQANHALSTSFVHDALKLYVVGARVSYSLSPAMHMTAFKACGLSHTYVPYSTTSLSTLSSLVHDPMFAGSSIGLPFKVEVISLTHSLSSHARAIGAVNTVIPIRRLNPDGSVPDDMAMFFNSCNRSGPVLALYGENTDWVGIRAVIRRGLSPANAVRPGTSGLVIGAGGMARAAVYSMLQLGVTNIAIFNRTRARAEKLVTHFTTLIARNDLPLLTKRSEDERHRETRFHILATKEDPWPEDKFRHPTMIVSCIPTHSLVEGGGGPSPNFTLPESWLQSPTGGVVIEYAYKDVNTPLLQQVRAAADRGWVAMDGLDLLPEQGFAQFELFTGRRAPRRLMREEVFRAYPGESDGRFPEQLKPRLNQVIDQGL